MKQRFTHLSEPGPMGPDASPAGAPSPEAVEKARELFETYRREYDGTNYTGGMVGVVALALDAAREGSDDTKAAYQSIVLALIESLKWIEDLCILIKTPNGTRYVHGGIPLSREESLGYTTKGALDFVSEIRAQIKEAK